MEFERYKRVSLNLLERSLDANNLRDKVSRAYYAVYHICIAFIFLTNKKFKVSTVNAHQFVREHYIKYYNRTNGNRVVELRNTEETLKEWKSLRESADYEVFTEDFEEASEEKTYKKLERMYDFINQHITYVDSKTKIDVKIPTLNTFSK